MEAPSQLMNISIEQIIGSILFFLFLMRYANHAMRFIENVGMNLYEVKIKKNGNGTSNGSSRSDDIEKLRRTISNQTGNWECKSVDTSQLLETLIKENRKTNRLVALQMRHMVVDQPSELHKELIQVLSEDG